MRRFLALLATLPLLAAAAPDVPVPIDEWTVPYDNSRPRDPDVAPDGSVWFVGQRGDYLARLDPATGTFSRHALADEPGPHNLIVGADGIVWYAGNLAGYIGRFNPKSGAVEKIAMPDAAAVDPHTLVFDADQTHIWFSVQGGNFVGRLTVATRKVELIKVPTANARPYGIVVAPDGAPWVALFGTNKLASIDPASLALTEHALPFDDARPRRLLVATNGAIFYGDYARGELGRLDPAIGRIKTWPLPGGSRSRPYGMAIDRHDRVWTVETGARPNRLVGFDPAREEFFAVVDIPSGAGSVRHMAYDPGTHTVWFGTDANTIGRADVPD
jgi:virginiamycin B lyase